MTKRIWMVHPTDALPGENGFKHGINLIEELDREYKPGLIDPKEYEICLVIPIRGKTLSFGKTSLLEFRDKYKRGIHH